jgi:DNA-binding NtrC family response regulator
VSSGPVPRIFVVDDEPLIASTLAAILQMNGFSAKFFTCPREALNAARLKAPDLLISDVAMPGISGVDLAIQMRAQYPACKILLFSGQASVNESGQSAEAQRRYPFLACCS